MMTETYRGSRIRVRSGRGASWGQMFVMVNGQPFPVAERVSEAKAISEIKRMLDYVYSSPIDGDRWPASYYAPGTYELCPEGIHPQQIGGQCTHATCRASIS